VDTLRPWDLSDGNWERPAPPVGHASLKPYQTEAELVAKTAGVLQRVDPALGEHFETMRREQLLDLENRKGKAPGGYCTYFATQRRPFIFMNAVGLHNDVQTLLHEAGHAFHAFESSQLRYLHQMGAPMEFSEVASMAMELLAAPYLTGDAGGFYTAPEAAQARVEHLEEIILFWPYMAVVDAFQHWAYTHPQDALDTDRCDATWRALWQRFIPAVDWSGLEAELVTGWQRKLHIYRVPLYYIEYGLARLGAVQVWGQALNDQAGAVARYRRALALGGTATLPQLYETAGARFAFDVETLGQAVTLIEQTLDTLEHV
jgi:oligoendopeptidase F